MPIKRCFRKVHICITHGDYIHAPLPETAGEDTFQYTIHPVFMQEYFVWGKRIFMTILEFSVICYNYGKYMRVTVFFFSYLSKYHLGLPWRTLLFFEICSLRKLKKGRTQRRSAHTWNQRWEESREMFALRAHQVKSILFNRDAIKLHNIVKYINIPCISSNIVMSSQALKCFYEAFS